MTADRDRPSADAALSIVYTTSEAAARLGMSVNTLRRKVAQGRIGYVRDGDRGPLFFLPAHITDYIAARRHDVGQPVDDA